MSSALSSARSFHTAVSKTRRPNLNPKPRLSKAEAISSALNLVNFSQLSKTLSQKRTPSSTASTRFGNSRL